MVDTSDHIPTPQHHPTNSIHTEEGSYIYEYNKNVRPPHKAVPIAMHDPELHWLDRPGQNSSADIPFDLSKQQDLTVPATSPNLTAGYIRLVANDKWEQRLHSTSLAFFVIRGDGKTHLDEGVVEWKEGDLVVIPAQSQAVKHVAGDCIGSDHGGAALYYCHDSPLLAYLSVKPDGKRFQATHFPAEVLRSSVEKVRQQPGAAEKNRIGVLLGNEHTAKTLTLSHVLWCLYNTVPAHSAQKPHRHNAVALDLCTEIHPDDEGKVYTLIGDEIDTNGEIINGHKAYWRKGAAFTTPLGLWHSHHNEGDHDAWVLPLQDAGLALHLGAYDIRFAQDEKERIVSGGTYKSIEY